MTIATQIANEITNTIEIVVNDSKFATISDQSSFGEGFFISTRVITEVENKEWCDFYKKMVTIKSHEIVEKSVSISQNKYNSIVESLEDNREFNTDRFDLHEEHFFTSNGFDKEELCRYEKAMANED